MSQEQCQHILGLCDYDTEDGIELVYEADEFEDTDFEILIFKFCPKCGVKLDT